MAFIGAAKMQKQDSAPSHLLFFRLFAAAAFRSKERTTTSRTMTATGTAFNKITLILKRLNEVAGKRLRLLQAMLV